MTTDTTAGARALLLAELPVGTDWAQVRAAIEDGSISLHSDPLSWAVEAALNALAAALQPAAADMGWQDIATAPKDGTRVKLRVIYEFEAEWRGGLLDDDEQECGGWHAVKGDIPPCWTDDICWSSNDDGLPSASPDSWRPLPAAPTAFEGGKK